EYAGRPVEPSEAKFVRGLAERAFDPPPLDIIEPVDLVEPAAANYADDGASHLRFSTSVDRGPDLALGRVEHAGGNDQEQRDFEPGAVPVLEPRLGSPGQKGDDVVRHLRHGRRHAIGKGNGVVAERWRHRDLVAREKLVVAHAREQIETRRRIFVAGQNTVYVI